MMRSPHHFYLELTKQDKQYILMITLVYTYKWRE